MWIKIRNKKNSSLSTFKNILSLFIVFMFIFMVIIPSTHSYKSRSTNRAYKNNNSSQIITMTKRRVVAAVPESRILNAQISQDNSLLRYLSQVFKSTNIIKPRSSISGSNTIRTKQPRKYGRRRHHRTKLVSKNGSSLEEHEEELACDGYANIIDDLGLITFLNDVALAVAGLFMLIYGVKSQIVAYLSSYNIAFPSILLLYLDEAESESNFLEGFYDNLGIADTMFDILINIPANDVFNIIGGLIEWLGVTNLYLETIATLPAYFDVVIEAVFGVDAREYFKDYGCNTEMFKGITGLDEVMERLG